MTLTKLIGHVERWLDGPGYGFLHELGTNTKYFFHKTGIKNGVPLVGSMVLFDPGTTTKGPIALNCEFISEKSKTDELLAAFEALKKNNGGGAQ